MIFAIATVDYFQQHGFDCADWRKSVDGTKAIIHAEFARTLITDLESDSNVELYENPSEGLKTLLATSEWCSSTTTV